MTLAPWTSSPSWKGLTLPVPSPQRCGCASPLPSCPHSHVHALARSARTPARPPRCPGRSSGAAVSGKPGGRSGRWGEAEGGKRKPGCKQPGTGPGSRNPAPAALCCRAAAALRVPLAMPPQTPGSPFGGLSHPSQAEPICTLWARRQENDHSQGLICHPAAALSLFPPEDVLLGSLPYSFWAVSWCRKKTRNFSLNKLI